MDTNKSDDAWIEICNVCHKANISLDDYSNPVKRLNSLYIAYQNGNASWEDYSNAVKREIESIDKNEKSLMRQIEVQSAIIHDTEEQKQDVLTMFAERAQSQRDAIREHIKRVDSIDGKIYKTC